MKAALKSLVVGGTRVHLRTDTRPLPRLLEGGLGALFDRADPEHHRAHLEAVFTELGAAGAARAVNLDRLRPTLEATKYKYALHGDRWGGEAGGWSFRLCSRLAAAHNLHFDILVLRSDAQVPPHAHEGTVSGMLVLEGEVGMRTFDVLNPTADGAELLPRLDGLYGPGGVSTSSDQHHNLHWIKGVAPFSLIFRYSLTGLGQSAGDPVDDGEPRHYILPQRNEDGGVTSGVWVDEATAKSSDFWA